MTLRVEGGVLIAQPEQKRYELADLLAECDFSQPMTAEEREWIEAHHAGLEMS
ncbi:MAG: SpoVT/AbrB protein [Rhizobacter sp.]|nr:SpoVT/AbrB protein [Rhizobacter sp.]